MPPVRICAGGGQRWPSLPRPLLSFFPDANSDTNSGYGVATELGFLESAHKCTNHRADLLSDSVELHKVSAHDHQSSTVRAENVPGLVSRSLRAKRHGIPHTPGPVQSINLL